MRQLFNFFLRILARKHLKFEVFFVSSLLKMLCNARNLPILRSIASCCLSLDIQQRLKWKEAFQTHDEKTFILKHLKYHGSLLPSLKSLKEFCSQKLWGWNLDFWNENTTDTNYVRTCLNSVKFKPVKSEVKFEESMTSVSRSVFEATTVSLVLRLSEEEALCFFFFWRRKASFFSLQSIRRASRHRQSDRLLFSRLLSLEV